MDHQTSINIFITRKINHCHLLVAYVPGVYAVDGKYTNIVRRGIRSLFPSYSIVDDPAKNTHPVTNVFGSYNVACNSSAEPVTATPSAPYCGTR